MRCRSSEARGVCRTDDHVVDAVVVKVEIPADHRAETAVGSAQGRIATRATCRPVESKLDPELARALESSDEPGHVDSIRKNVFVVAVVTALDVSTERYRFVNVVVSRFVSAIGAAVTTACQ